MYARLLEASLRASAADTPATFVAGARQTGKSTLVERFGRDAGWSYRTLDDLNTLASARADPQGFVEGLTTPTILDEVQRAPDLFLPIKRAIDGDRRPGRFVLTGSANVLALPRVAESLAGRVEVLTLWPLAQCELAGTASGFIDACFEGRPDALTMPGVRRGELLGRMLRGGYPETVARPTAVARERWFDAYLATILQRDLRDLANVEHLTEVPALLRAVAARSGSPLNVADLGRMLGLSQMTTKRYLALLEALYLLVRVPPWFENLGKRLARAPKLYLADAGLLAHLLGLDEGALAARPASGGPLAETFALGELLRLAPHSRSRPSVSHLRTSDGLEVDAILENRRGQIVGAEVKLGATVGTSDFKGLTLLRDRLAQRFACGVVLHGGTDVLPFGPRMWAVPLSALWSPPPRASARR